MKKLVGLCFSGVPLNGELPSWLYMFFFFFISFFNSMRVIYLFIYFCRVSLCECVRRLCVVSRRLFLGGSSFTGFTVVEKTKQIDVFWHSIYVFYYIYGTSTLTK